MVHTLFTQVILSCCTRFWICCIGSWMHASYECTFLLFLLNPWDWACRFLLFHIIGVGYSRYDFWWLLHKQTEFNLLHIDICSIFLDHGSLCAPGRQHVPASRCRLHDSNCMRTGCHRRIRGRVLWSDSQKRALFVWSKL